MACFVLCYDISDKKRLQKLHRLVSNHLIQIQYSVYYGEVSTEDMDILIQNIQKIIHKTQDDVRVYETQPFEQALVIGKRSPHIMMFSERGQLFI